MKEHKISIRLSDKQYRHLSDKGCISKVLSDIIDRDMSDIVSLSDKVVRTGSVITKETVPTKPRPKDIPPVKKMTMFEWMEENREIVSPGRFKECYQNYLKGE